MSNYQGDFLEDATVYIPFNTFSSNDPQASVTITNLVAGDIKVHKDAGLTQIATDGATIAIDYDGITGNHMITIDTSVHADYSKGSDYQVRIEGTTVDAGTINAFIGSFSIENRYKHGVAQTVDNNVLAAGSTGFAAIDTVVDTLLTRIIGTIETGSHNPASTAQLAALTDWINGGRLDLILDIIAADTTTNIPALIASSGKLGNAPQSFTLAKGATSQIIQFSAYDASDTVGDKLTGLVFNSASLTAHYNRSSVAGSAVSITLASETKGTWGTGGFIAVDATNQPGEYELHVPDLALASAAGVDRVTIVIQGAANLKPVTINIELVNEIDLDASGNVILETATQASIDAIEADTNELQGDWINGGRLDLLLDAIKVITDQITFTTANQVDANMLAISSDGPAADNLENTFDGTGYTNDEAPAKQSQLSSLANVGSAVHKASSSYTLTTGTQSANLFSDTEALDGVRHEHTDTTGAMELYYEFSIGAGTASSVQVTGYVTGNNDDLDVYGYDWVTASFKQIGNMQGSNSTLNSVQSFDLFVDMVGSGGDEGKVRVRFFKASGLTTALLAIDQIFVAFNQGSEGYDNGAVWLDTNKSNTNTEVNIDGTARNPVSTIAAVNTLLASTGLHRVQVAPGSSFTLAASQTDEVFVGEDWTLAMGGQDVSGSFFHGASISGTATSPTKEMHFVDCEINTCTLGEVHFNACGLGATITASAAGDYIFQSCYSNIAGSATPKFDFGAAVLSTNTTFANYSNGIEFDNFNNAGTDLLSLSGIGKVVYSASCSGTVNQRGHWEETNTGGVTINRDLSAQNSVDILVDTADMQPKIGTPTDTNLATDLANIQLGVPTAAQLAYIVANAATGLPVTFTTSGGTTTNAVINLVDGGASSTTADQYNGRLLVFTNGTLKGVVTDITDWDGANNATITAIPTAPTSSHVARLI